MWGVGGTSGRGRRWRSSRPLVAIIGTGGLPLRSGGLRGQFRHSGCASRNLAHVVATIRVSAMPPGPFTRSPGASFVTGAHKQGLAGWPGDPCPVRQLPTVLIAGVYPEDLLSPGSEPPTPDHRFVAVAGLAPPPGLGVGDHAEATPWEQGEGFGVVGVHGISLDT